MAFVERLIGTSWKKHSAAFLVGAGHGATHWILATFYVILPFLAKDLGLSYTEAGALVSLFHASSFAANFGSGAVVDIGGRRVLIQAVSLTIAAIALIAVGFAANVLWLLAPIIFIGMTNNLWHPAAISYLSRKFPTSRGFALSIHTLGASMGDILAPVAAGSLLLVLNWQQTAIVHAVPVFAIAAVLIFSLTEIERAPKAADKNASPRGNYRSGVATLLRNRPLIGLCIMSGFRAMTQNGLMLILPLYLVGVLNASPVTLGIAIMAFQVGGIFAGPIAGVWSDRIGHQPVVLAGLTVSSALIFGLTLVDTMIPFIAISAALGFALFSVRPVIHSWVMDMVDEDMAGTAISVLFGSQSAFTFIVPIASGMIADLWGLKVVFYLLTITIFIATAITYTLPKPRR